MGGRGDVSIGGDTSVGDVSVEVTPQFLVSRMAPKEIAAHSEERERREHYAPRSPSLYIITEFKPDNLTEDFTPIELREWKRQFRAYYVSSIIQYQQQWLKFHMLFTCVDREIARELIEQGGEDSPIFGESGSCMQIIDNFFKKIYPILCRRIDYFNNKQGKQTGVDLLARSELWARKAKPRSLPPTVWTYFVT